MHDSPEGHTNVVFGGGIAVKLFRRTEPGIHPDLELRRFLTERTSFHALPAVLGALDYRGPEEASTVALLQEYVPHGGTAWELLTDSLGLFYDELAAAPLEFRTSPPVRRHPLRLMGAAPLPGWRSASTPTSRSARRWAGSPPNSTVPWHPIWRIPTSGQSRSPRSTDGRSPRATAPRSDRPWRWPGAGHPSSLHRGYRCGRAVRAGRGDPDRRPIGERSGSAGCGSVPRRLPARRDPLHRSGTSCRLTSPETHPSRSASAG